MGRGINLSHFIDNLPSGKKFIVVYSSAIPNTNQELEEARKRKITCFKYEGYLSLISKKYQKVVAIAGSHGKTTVTAIFSNKCKRKVYPI